MSQAIERAERLYKADEVDQALKAVEDYLWDAPDCPRGLLLAGKIFNKSDHPVTAYQYLKRLVRITPRSSIAWTNLGTVTDTLWLMEECEEAHKKAVEFALMVGEKALALNNLSALYIQLGRFERGEKYALECLEIEPDNRLARSNLGLCQLARHEWKAGFENFDSCIGTPSRLLVDYGGEKRWEGERVEHLVTFAEQGLGDEIMFSSLIPDVMKRVGRVTIDCDHRLEGLFRRSFPQCHVYGTRWEGKLPWPIEDQKIDASCAFGHLGAFVRQKNEDFPGTPWLRADPDRVFMWKSLFKSIGKPVIGLSWSGGVRRTGEKFRRLNLKDFLPIFKSIDAHWVSLEYRDRSREVNAWNDLHPEHKVHIYPYATLSKDYDDTAALIASLDAFVGIHTTALHCAGGLGIPAYALVSKVGQWRYAKDEYPWYPASLFRQRGDYWPMRELSKALNDQFRRAEGGYSKVA